MSKCLYLGILFPVLSLNYGSCHEFLCNLVHCAPNFYSGVLSKSFWSHVPEFTWQVTVGLRSVTGGNTDSDWIVVSHSIVVLVSCFYCEASGITSSTASWNPNQCWCARVQYGQDRQGKWVLNNSAAWCRSLVQSWHICRRDNASALTCCFSGLCCTVMWYWLSSSSHRASWPCGSRKFNSHVKLLWSVRTVNYLPNK